MKVKTHLKLTRLAISKKISHFVLVPLVIFFRNFMHLGLHPAPCCRFEPTCLSYTKDAFSNFDLWTAFRLVFRRILRCRPGGGSGFDPLPLFLKGDSRGR